MSSASVEQDLAVLETRDLRSLQERLQQVQRFREGKLRGSNRVLKPFQREAEETAPEKTAGDLEILKCILGIRRDTERLLTGLSQPAAVPVRTEPKLQAPQPERDFPPPEQCLFASTQAVERAWENGFQMLLGRVAGGTYSTVSDGIWEGMQNMHRHLHWYKWPITKIQQDHTSEPIMIHIDPDDPVLVSKNDLSTRMQVTGGLNVHAAQRGQATDAWAGIALTKGLALHLSINGQIEHLQQFRTQADFESAECKEFYEQIYGDATIAYMHGLEHCTGGRLFAEVNRQLALRNIQTADQLRDLPTDQFLIIARSLDRLFVDAPPFSPQEANERLHTYFHALAFQLQANISNGGRPFEKVGSYDRRWLTRNFTSEDCLAYLRTFQPAQPVSPSVEPVSEPEVPESPSDRVVRWTGQARELVRTLDPQRCAHEIPQKPDEIRRDLQSRSTATMRILEAVSAIDRWAEEIAGSGFPESFDRALNNRANDQDLALVRTQLQNLSGMLALQAFHDGRLNGLNEQELMELLLATGIAVADIGASCYPNQGKNRPYLGGLLSCHVLYVLLRDNQSPRVRSAVERLCLGIWQLDGRGLKPDVGITNFLLSCNGVVENGEIRRVSESVRDLPASNERGATLSGLNRRTRPFAYAIERLHHPKQEHVLIVQDPSVHDSRLSATVIGDVSIDSRAHAYCLPGGHNSSELTIGIIIDSSGSGYGSFAVRPNPERERRILIPETQDPDVRKELDYLRQALPGIILEKQREIRVICANVSPDIVAQTVFVEWKGGLYARCPASDIARHYGTTVDMNNLPPQIPGWETVRLPTIADLEAAHFQGIHVNGNFASSPESGRAPLPIGGDAETATEREEGSLVSSPEPHAGRVRLVHDALLKLRSHATYAWDEGGDISGESGQINFSEARSGHWIVIDVPAFEKMVLVSDIPERTYVCPRQPVETFAQSDALSARRLHQLGAVQVFFNSEEQFESSLIQALRSAHCTLNVADSVESLISQHGTYVRQRIEALIVHLNSRSRRGGIVTIDNLALGAVRGHIHSGEASGEPHCGKTILKELARMAGFHDPIEYPVLRQFFDELMAQLRQPSEES